MAVRIEPGVEPITGHRLLARLGGGGFGEVWSCRAPDGSVKAVKLVRGDLAAVGPTVRTAEQELRGLHLVGPVRHPSLLTPERYDVVDGQLLILMPLADGNLWDVLQARRGRGQAGIPRADLLRHLADAADGLDVLRGHNLQHLDVKPQNLFLVAGRGVVGDFGLVRDLRSGRPGTGATPAYSAPETFAGGLSPHCDQYGLAVVYQELLTGTRPFAGATPEQLAQQHLTGQPNLAPLPPADRPAVARALAKKPEDRFPSCADFIRALSRGSVPPVAAHELSGSPPAHPVRGSSIPPAVVLGVGGVGGLVLRRLRQALADRGTPPQVRLVYVDTDPDAIRSAVEAGDLGAAEVLPAALQRADHYASLRVDPRTSATVPWFSPAWLYRLAAAGVPDGCRGLGRLAFTDHFRAIAQKVEADLAAVTRAAPGRPRVVIVAGLVGGTGGGMALDLAYLARHLLRPLGTPPDVAGWLLLPAAEADDRATANAFAALRELRHFARPETSYRARCDDPPDSLTTRDAPFADVVVLPPDPAAAADALLRELVSADHATTGAGECRTTGQARLVWPRRAIVRRAARRLAAAVLERWTSADTRVAEPVRAWMAEQWPALDLGPEALTKRLRAAAATAVGQLPEDAFDAVAGPAALRRADAVPEAVARLDGLLGRLAAALAVATDGLVGEWGTRQARPAVTLVERPDFRLAGAEAAVRLLGDTVERFHVHVGAAADGWQRKADVARAAGGDEAVQSFPRYRYQGLVLRQVAAVYAALRRQLADQLAELGLCRTRLAAVQETIRSDSGWPATQSGGLLLPPGCKSIAEAADRVPVEADDLRELDRRAQRHLHDTAGGLTRACLSVSDLPRTLAPALVELAEPLVEPRLGDGAAELFLSQHPGPDGFQALWSAAAPPFAGPDEVTTVVCPEPLADLARQALGPDVAVTASTDEVAVVRTVRLPLASLPQLGPAAAAAFQRRKAAGEFAHARVDILFDRS